MLGHVTLCHVLGEGIYLPMCNTHLWMTQFCSTFILMTFIVRLVWMYEGDVVFIVGTLYELDSYIWFWKTLTLLSTVGEKKSLGFSVHTLFKQNSSQSTNKKNWWWIASQTASRFNTLRSFLWKATQKHI